MSLSSLSSLFALNYSSLQNNNNKKRQTILPEMPWIFKQWCPCGYKKYTAVLFTEVMTCNIVPAFNRM